ncbi:MAG TPA: protein-L-isoaspartate(D-aspartate) O-methyltransferase [Steroidobacteraceae bacterium]|nr:protein-L-isoaspartate(D-aspartate) O-methyltransferase [Steroidobacteraceae bacterium]
MTDLRLSGIGMTSARTRERLVQRLKDNGIRNPTVLDRIRSVPRHLFVDEAIASRAYEDVALPIGFGQTISQPWIVARMTEALLEGGPLNDVLEIGTGCGYQTAVLAPLVGKIYSIERVAPLLERARERLKELGIKNVRFRHGDGGQGWLAHAPYDGILVAAAPHAIPDVLLEQLAPGGRMVVPIGAEGEQELMRITREDNRVKRERLGAVAFVPLVQGPV